MKKIVSFVAFCLMCNLVAPSHRAQQAKPKTQSRVKSKSKHATQTKDEIAKLKQVRRERVAQVLREVATDAGRWTEAKAAATVQAQVADLLWDVDAAEARGYLVAAWKTSARVEDAKTERSRFRNDSVQLEARREVILVARRRAPELAEQYLAEIAEAEATEEDDKQNKGAFDDRTRRSTVLLQMALSVVERDAAAASELAIESLRDGVSYGFQAVLLGLQAKSFPLAQKTFRAALMRLRTRGLVDPNELLILQSYLYTPGRTPAANTSEHQNTFQLAVGRDRPNITAAAAQLNPELAQEFLIVAADALLNFQPSASFDAQTAARSQVSVAGGLVSRIAQVAPDKATLLQQRLAQLSVEARYSPTPAKPPAKTVEPRHGETKDEYNERQVNELEEAAKQERDELSRNILLAKAALATTVEQLDRGSGLAAKITDKELRANVSNLLAYRATLDFIKRKNYEAARTLITRNTNPAHKAASLTIGANNLLQAKDVQLSQQWLAEANALLKTSEPDGNLTRAGIGIVASYAQVDKLAALEALRNVVNLINLDSDLKLEDERAPEAKGFAGLNFPDFTRDTHGFGLNALAKAFDEKHFEEVLTELNRIKSPPLRGQAMLVLCREQMQAIRAD